MNKINNLVEQKDLEKVVKKLKEQNKKIVATNGCFDILHIGHVRYLNESKKLGDVLILCLNSDVSVKKLKGDSRPINAEQDRAEILLALESVDYVVLFDEQSPSDLLDIIKPDIYTKGGDYDEKNLPEYPVIMKNNGKIVFINFVEGKSTTSTIEKMKAH